jgi:hypothetical protein
MNETSSSPTEATSDPSDELYTPEQVRGNLLPRMFLARSLVRHMAQRLKHAHVQEAYARASTAPERVHAWLATVATTWLLIENTLKLYETFAAQVDTRSESQRISLQSQFMREHDSDEDVTFHGRVWLFQQLDAVGDDVFTTAGIDAMAGRALLRNMVARSQEYLRASDEQMRDFYRKYRLIANAFKHGRALFAFVPVVTETGFSLRASETAVSAFIQKKFGRGRPTRFVTFTADDEVIGDVTGILSLLDVQVSRFVTFFESFTAGAIDYLAYLEGNPPETLPMMHFSLFADPYSEDEAAVLTALSGARLRTPPVIK